MSADLMAVQRALLAQAVRHEAMYKHREARALRDFAATLTTVVHADAERLGLLERDAFLRGGAVAGGLVAFGHAIRSFLTFRRLEDLCGGPGSLDSTTEVPELSDELLERIFGQDPE